MEERGWLHTLAPLKILVNGAGESLGLLLADLSCPHYSTEFARALPANSQGQRAPHMPVSLSGKGAHPQKVASHPL